jgi:DNA polymerase-3 subunit alpha
MLRRGESIAVFQLESSGMRELLRQMKPDTFEDLIALLALYRPGPLGSGMDKTYVKRKHGEESVQYPHPQLEDILRETNGVILYQEQVMRISNILAGFSLNEADNLRKAMGKKKMHLMTRFRRQFIEGCKKHEIPDEQANYIFDLMEEFASYGFNKSHSAAYALVSYQTAFLKANYPKEYMAAVLSCEMHNTDKVAWFLEECRRMKIPISPPDVNLSKENFSVKDGKIVYALTAIKNVGREKVKQIVKTREKLKTGAFTSIYHFMEEVDSTNINKTVLENMTKAGAFDSTHPCRAAVYSGIPKAIAVGSARQKDRALGQLSFDDLLVSAGKQPVQEEVTYPETQPWSEMQKLAFEKEVLGLYLSGHPLTHHGTLIRALSTTALDAIADAPAGKLVLAAVQLVDMRVTKTRKGDAMAFIKIEDLSGQGEAVVFPESYETYKDVLELDQPFFLKGSINDRDGERSLITKEIIPISEAPAKLARSVSVSVDTPAMTEDSLFVLKRIFFEHPGSCPVDLIFCKNAMRQTLSVSKNLSVSPDSSMLKELQGIQGVTSVAIQTELQQQQQGILAS